MTRHVHPGDDYSSSGCRSPDQESPGAPRRGGSAEARPGGLSRPRRALHVNDINVTGTQQYFQRALDAVHPASIHWLYVIQVDPSLGRSNPEVEYSLSYLNLDSFEVFAEIVARADIEYTSRCVARLFAHPQVQLEPLFRSLDPTRRKQLQQLVTEKGAYTGEECAAKVGLLRE